MEDIQRHLTYFSIGALLSIILVGSCSWFSKAGSDVASCAKTEASVSTSTLVGYAIKLGADVVSAVTGNTAPLLADIAAFGEPLCACLANDIAAANPPTSAPSSGSGAATSQPIPNVGDAARSVIASHHWDSYKPGGAK